jgi:hypothetical protein
LKRVFEPNGQLIFLSCQLGLGPRNLKVLSEALPDVFIRGFLTGAPEANDPKQEPRNVTVGSQATLINFFGPIPFRVHGKDDLGIKYLPMGVEFYNGVMTGPPQPFGIPSQFTKPDG